MPRELTSAEVDDLLSRDVVARLASIDDNGYPHVTPIWFLWHQGRFFMTSYSTRAHVQRCIKNPRAGLVIDVEDPLRQDGERPNRQVRVIGNATVAEDHSYAWTRRIRGRYIGDVDESPNQQPARQRSVIELRPVSVVAVASV